MARSKRVQPIPINAEEPDAVVPDTRSEAELLEALSRDELIDLLETRGVGRIQISFVGKANARQIARKVRPRVFRPVKSLSAGDPESQAENLVIEGDNLQAMATLYKQRGQVDLIITDPPYNTGGDWRYNDRWDEDPNDPGIGEIVAEDEVGRHTKWMKFMWPRLQMMKAMLRPGGILAICIDFRELFRLGQMLDEMFGEKNRLGIVNWQRTYSPSNDAEHVAVATEYVLVYAKPGGRAKTRLLPRESASGVVSNPDADPVEWTDAPASGSNAKAHKSMVYAIQSPFTGEIHYPPPGSAWRQGQDRNLEQLRGWGCKFVLKDIDDAAERAALIGLSIEEIPDVKAIMLGEPLSSARKKATALHEVGIWPKFYFLSQGQGRPRLKKYTHELQEGYVATTYWSSEDIDSPPENATVVDAVSWPHQVSGHSQQGVDELTSIVGPGHEFKTVKPLKLFTKIIRLWSPDDGLVMDPFAGSGTAGHAVLQVNQEDESSRRFIIMEQGRPEQGDSYARTLTAVRLSRAVTGKRHKGKANPLGGGYTFTTLAKKVDASALLRMERDEMVDTVIASHFDATRRRGAGLIRISGNWRYLVARTTDDQGFFLVWDGPSENTDLTKAAYSQIAAEAKKSDLAPPYHVYARLHRYQTSTVRFYQIPDRILADFGLDLRDEPFSDIDE